ncbi:hypothetical protein [Agrobacterium cavarae]|uniref:hypothetical protein n=1 Tax=Agrobacterium cavarae TaxID=2528239 RepID=UPI0028AAB6FD|nr:hypothetical protein [Agrobacterium cavarae]
MVKKVEESTERTQQTCFVVGPIGGAGTEIRTHADWLLDGIIKPTFREHYPDFEVVRSDTITAPGMIDTQMINHLLDADLVIVDMSLLNANAFYEMGIRHMARKPVIHMFVAGTSIPFDVKPYRAIEFSLVQHAHLGVAQQHLKNAIQDAISPDYVPDNPVTKAQNYTQIERTAEPADKILMQELLSLKSEVNALKKSHPNRNVTIPNMRLPSKAVKHVGLARYGSGDKALSPSLQAEFPFIVTADFANDVVERIDLLFQVGSWAFDANLLRISVANVDPELIDAARTVLLDRGATETDIVLGLI